MTNYDDEDTKEYIPVISVPTLDLFTVDAPRSTFSHAARQLAKNADADFWLPTPPPITMRMRTARALRRLANVIERGR